MVTAQGVILILLFKIYIFGIYNIFLKLKKKKKCENSRNLSLKIRLWPLP